MASTFRLAGYSSYLLYFFAILPGAACVAMIYAGTSGNEVPAYVTYSAALPGLICLVMLYAGYAMNHISLVADDEVGVRGIFYGRTVPRSSVQGDGVRKVDLRGADRKLAPGRRTNGFGSETLSYGWFDLEDGQKALVALSDRSRAVYVPTSGEFALLLSPDDPDRFIEQLTSSSSHQQLTSATD